jgi:hypothetical protein
MAQKEVEAAGGTQPIGWRPPCSCDAGDTSRRDGTGEPCDAIGLAEQLTGKPDLQHLVPLTRRRAVAKPARLVGEQGLDARLFGVQLFG